MDLTEKDKEEPSRKRRETRKVLDPVRIAGKKRRNNDDRILEEDYKNVLIDNPTTATVSDPVIESSAKNEVEQSGAQLPVLEDISRLFDGSVSSSLGAMRPLVEKLGILLAPAQEHYKRLPKRIKEGVHLLKDDVEVISSYLDELSELEDPPPVAICWMNEARDLSYDMVSEHGTKTSKIIHVNVPRLPSKPKIAETISEFRIYVQEAFERHDRYKLQCCSTLRRRRFLSAGSMLPMPYDEVAQIVIDGRMNEFICSLAANDTAGQQQLKVVSVLGSGCLGKTTLANVLYERIEMQFECRAFIRVSRKSDMKRLFSDLFSQLHKKQPLPASCNELGISDNTSKHLQHKRYLIVIDDLWDASVWDIIKYAFPNGNCGSRIIITTQIEDVALTCCCDHTEHVFEMKPLDDAHSRMLFFNRLFGSENDCPAEFKQVSNEIIDICGGLPLATMNIASHLANQQTAVSLDLLTYIRDSLRSHLWSSSTSERTRQVLTLSYNNLPHYLKTCLLYLHMYPEGSIIWKDDLSMQWVAEASIVTQKGKGQYQDRLKKAAGICFDELIDRRFIQPSYINYNNEVLSCTVHDVVRELIAHKSAEENFIVVVDYNRKNIALSHKVRRLSLIFGDAKYAKTPENITKSQVRSLRFFGLFDCMPCIRDFKVLRVLNLQLSGHCGLHDPIDLTGISELFQLRYLKIASDVCIKLPNHIRGLQCLETLDVMDATRVTAIPWDIIHLPHLFHLALPVDTNLLGTMTDSVVSLWSLCKLNYLQDLYLTISSTPCSGHPEKNMESLGSLLEGHGSLKNIVVSHGPSVKDIVVPGASKVIISWDDLEPPPLLQRFECSPHSCVIFSQIPKWLKELGNLCILKMAVMELQMSSVDILRGLPALIDLSLYVQWAPGERIIFDKAAGFSVLKYFKLRCTSGIPWLKFEADAMPNLWKLTLGFNAIPRMDQHQLIRIEHMPDLKEISVKFGGAAAHIEYAVRSVVSNHPRNPTINMQLVNSSSYGDESTEQSLPINWAPESCAADAVADVEPLRRLSDNLATAFHSPDDFAFLADMCIAMPGAPDLHVHRYMLSVRSPFLHAFFARRASVEGNRLELWELLGEKVEVGYEALQLVLEYLYSARFHVLPRPACVCVDMDGCAHVSCHPVISFMVQVLFVTFTFQITELTNYFQRHLLDVLDDVEVDNLPLILSVANLCNKSCMKLLDRCLEMVVRSNLEMITLEKALPPDVMKQITDARLSLGLVSPEDKGFPYKHARRILRALDSSDVELVRMLLKEGQTNLDDAFALHYAVEHCNSKITTELLDIAHANVNHRNPRGYTVLHIAARRRDPKILVSLLTKGARPSDLTFDGRKAIQIAKRLTKHRDYFGITEEGKPSPKDRLCIEVLEQAERWDPQVGEASVSLARVGDCEPGKLLYLENRVGLARIHFPVEARVAMDIAQLDGTSEFILGSSADPPPEIQQATVDLNETSLIMNDEHLARMRALSKTVELVRRFFPRCSNVLDKIMDDESKLASLGKEASMEKRRFHDVHDSLQKAFSEDKESSCLTSL
ncbi:disease resistance protein RGA5-like isoform X4 [Triticum urartu]|uniref:disease resistance protein RGA5-like isoform X4 n=1 Tax=Triticum urartu TaxID=4572 RepID=UPI0020443027|nr:disease resistance protein RGA5-like isoform X4 [Triticum urartu]XP_048544926.1 disease resistance protein RGA5-like isoform X4 [Triticum urartu]